MPNLYYVRDELGLNGPMHSTLAAAKQEFDDMIADGDEPEGVHSISYSNNRRSVAALVNMFRDEGFGESS